MVHSISSACEFAGRISSAILETTSLDARVRAATTSIPFESSFVGYLIGRTFYMLFDQGVANVLGLETLRHGTNPVHYIGIRILGGQPKAGGLSTGSTHGLTEDDTRGWFYVFKDSKLAEGCEEDYFTWCPGIILFPLIKRFFSKMHCAFSGFNLFTRPLKISWQSDWILPFKVINNTSFIAFGILGFASSLILTPVVKFRVSDPDDYQLIEDNMYGGGVAYKTNQAIGPWRIGLLGSIVSGCNHDWYSRAKANPMKILTGAAQLVAACGLGIILIRSVAEFPSTAVPIALGMLLS